MNLIAVGANFVTFYSTMTLVLSTPMEKCQIKLILAPLWIFAFYDTGAVNIFLCLVKFF
jgi:hypothetical protein